MQLSNEFTFFMQNSFESNSKAKLAFESECDWLYNPHYNKRYHFSTLFHPFARAVQWLLDSIQLGVGVILMGLALCTLDPKEIKKVGLGLVDRVASLLLNEMTFAISLISLATRLFATIINGYAETNESQLLSQPIAEQENFDANFDFVMPF